MTEKAVAFIVARLTSSRLPDKQFREIGRRTILDWIVDELKRSSELEEVVLATVNERENEPLREFAERRGIPCFWFEGEVDHVTTRLRRAAEEYEAELSVLVSGDCPLIYAPAIDLLVRRLRERPSADYVQLPPRDGQAPALQGVVAGRRRAWQLADDLADRPELKEHQFPLLYQRPDLFEAVEVELEQDLYFEPHRLSVDTTADLDFLNRVAEELFSLGQPFRLPEVLDILRESPDLKKINAHVHQRTLTEKGRKCLLAVDAGGEFGRGHLMRCMELAAQLVERLGWAVEFLVDEKASGQILETHGFRWRAGSLGRPSRLPQKGPLFDGDLELLLIDIFDGRDLSTDWRELLPREIRTVAIESLQPWVWKADLHVSPNVLGRVPEVKSEKGRRLRVCAGEEFLILRREVRRLRESAPAKDLDLLAYLHQAAWRRELEVWTEKSGLRSWITAGGEKDFLKLLARSRWFVSAFGVSFYEALALDTIPICRPDSAAHREDAKRFYAWWGVEPLICETEADLAALLLREDQIREGGLPDIEDGTPAVVEEIRRMVEGE